MREVIRHGAESLDAARRYVEGGEGRRMVMCQEHDSMVQWSAGVCDYYRLLRALGNEVSSCRMARVLIVAYNEEEKMTGAERIAAERQRQIEVEGWTAEHDAQHDDNQLRWSAACYLLTGHFSIDGDDFAQRAWPWNPEWWKPSDDPIRNLEKAGALIAAEIDRLLEA